MPSGRSLITIAFALYLLLMLAIGLVAYRRTRNLADYVLGGRGLGRWVTALSAGASDMSGWLLMGLPGLAYLSGFQAGWLALGLFVGTYLNWRLIAYRLRRYTERAGNALTLPDFFERRFNDHSGLLRGVSAFFILVFFTFYASSGLVAGGKLFNNVFGVSYTWAVVLGALVILLYTSLGGFLAVSWTDLVQGLLMWLALIVVPVVAIWEQGGWRSAQGAVEQANGALLDPLTAASGEPLSWVAILSLAGWGLGYFGQPHILARFMAIRHPAHITQARWIAVSWVGIALVGALLVGVAGVGVLDRSLVGADSEKVFMELVSLLFHPAVAGLLLAAILAAIMSTADSQLLVASSAFTETFYRKLWRPQASQRELVWAGRGAVVAIAVVALALALKPENKVLELVAYAWAGFGAAFGPVVLLGLYWRRMTRDGALAGIVAGGVTVILWRSLEGGWFELYEMIPGVAASLAAIVVSRLGTEAPPQLAEQFEAVVGETHLS